MPFDGSGNFNRLMNWVNDAAANLKIRADRHDQEDNNFAAGLSQCLTKDGQTLPTANIGLNGKKIINLADPTAAQDAVTRAYLEAALVNDFSFVQQQVKLASGAITLHAETKAFLVEVQGAGGAGASCPAGGAASQSQAGSGGGAGGYSSKWIVRPAGTYSPSCVVGAGGAGGGGASSFGDGGTNTLTVGGGVVGNQSGVQSVFGTQAGAAGGSASGGGVNIAGEPGDWSMFHPAPTARSGKGANSRFGSGGVAVGGSVGGGSYVGTAATGYGSGGGGAAATSTGGGVAGGAGADGIVVITEFR
jgi:hypothetical protein